MRDRVPFFVILGQKSGIANAIFERLSVGKRLLTDDLHLRIDRRFRIL